MSTCTQDRVSEQFWLKPDPQLLSHLLWSLHSDPLPQHRSNCWKGYNEVEWRTGHRTSQDKIISQSWCLFTQGWAQKSCFSSLQTSQTKINFSGMSCCGGIESSKHREKRLVLWVCDVTSQAVSPLRWNMAPQLGYPKQGVYPWQCTVLQLVWTRSWENKEGSLIPTVKWGILCRRHAHELSLSSPNLAKCVLTQFWCNPIRWRSKLFEITVRLGKVNNRSKELLNIPMKPKTLIIAIY